MSVRITDPANVALYDSVTGIAFGTVFRSDVDAADFLDWMDAHKHADVRVFTSAQLAVFADDWLADNRLDDDRRDMEAQEVARKAGIKEFMQQLGDDAA